MMKHDFISPILVLTLICLVISGALAFTNNVTAPIIADAAAIRETAARFEVIPDAGDFEPVYAPGFPSSIKEAYKATSGAGYTFTVNTSGYGGDLTIICSIDLEGKIIGSKVIEHSETKGLGSKITEAPFSSQFNGINSSLEGVSAISGATISSTAYTGAIRDAFSAFEILLNEG